jgi:hypothetical protein
MRLAAEMIFQACTGDLFAVVQIFRTDEANDGVDQERLEASSNRMSPRLESAGRRHDAHSPTARCPARSRNT